MPLRNGGFVFYVDVWAFFNRPAVGLFELRNISQLVRGRTMCASTRVVILRQHRTIPALRLKHRFGGCGTASALPKCSIMSGCSTRIVLRGQKPLALCEPLPLLRFAVSATGGAHLCSIQYYLRFWLGICRTSLAVPALRIMRYCPKTRGRSCAPFYSIHIYQQAKLPPAYRAKRHIRGQFLFIRLFSGGVLRCHFLAN